MPPTLIQSPVGAVVPSMLMQRQPVLIQDEIVRPDRDLPSSVFKWLHVPFATATHVVSDRQSRTTRVRYTLLWVPMESPTGGAAQPPPRPASRASTRHAECIDISRGADVTGVRVMMYPGQVLVLPPGWRYSSSSGASLYATSLRGP
jgi:hypothetical protein